MFYFITCKKTDVPALSLKYAGVLIFEFPRVPVFAHYCCQDSTIIGYADNAVLMVSVEKRSELLGDQRIKRLRTREPEGGWASLALDNLSVVMC